MKWREKVMSNFTGFGLKELIGNVGMEEIREHIIDVIKTNVETDLNDYYFITDESIHEMGQEILAEIKEEIKAEVLKNVKDRIMKKIESEIGV